MLILQSVEIKNFVCFDKIEIKPSTDPDRRLTVIRAENGSGKTTLLRALSWGMYGEEGLPGDGSRFSIHPAWWQPDAVGIDTRVTILFEADGSSRHYAETGNETTLYRLDRTVKTKGVETSKDDEPNFRRIGENASLMFRKLDGTWEKHHMGPEAVIKELLPWELRDFFVMNTDEATDFVGGSENKTIPRKEVQEKTTAAITGLLGIDIFKSAKERVESIAQEFRKKATKVIGDHDLNELQEELNEAHSTKTEIETKISEGTDQESELRDRLTQLDGDLETEFRRSGSHEDLNHRLSVNQDQYNKAVKSRTDCAARLAADLESPDLLASLALTAVSHSYNHLKPMYDQGEIPMKYLPYVQGLMESGRCVCGQTLLEDNEPGRKVKELISDSAAVAERADFLYQLHDAARSLKLAAKDSTWNERREKNAADLSQLDTQISDLKTEEKHLTGMLEQIDDENIQIIRYEKKAVQTQLDACIINLKLNEDQRSNLEQEIDSLTKKISQRQRNEREADDYRASENIARSVVEILNRAYSTIENQQVSELSKEVNHLFEKMAANVSDDDIADTQPNKATLRMISQVGVRPIGGNPGKFEIFALNGHDQSMSPMEINGASRRVMALSFVLALCGESQTRAPLIADSLLNFMSGKVRSNTLRVCSQRSNQPILLLTSADLEAPSEVETVNQYAGATYTLTGQWDATEAGRGGDVVNWTEQHRVSLLCSCGPRQYCSICERTWQTGAPGWTGRTN